MVVLCREEENGHRIGFYQLKGSLGRGNFSSVRLARHSLTGGEAHTADTAPLHVGLTRPLFAEHFGQNGIFPKHYKCQFHRASWRESDRQEPAGRQGAEDAAARDLCDGGLRPPRPGQAVRGNTSLTRVPGAK